MLGLGDRYADLMDFNGLFFDGFIRSFTPQPSKTQFQIHCQTEPVEVLLKNIRVLLKIFVSRSFSRQYWVWLWIIYSQTCHPVKGLTPSLKLTIVRDSFRFEASGLEEFYITALQNANLNPLSD